MTDNASRVRPAPRSPSRTQPNVLTTARLVFVPCLHHLALHDSCHERVASSSRACLNYGSFDGTGLLSWSQITDFRAMPVHR